MRSARRVTAGAERAAGEGRLTALRGTDSMPVILQPLPRHIHRTHENFALGEPASLSCSPAGNTEVVAALRQLLEPLFPALARADADASGAPRLRFTLF